jgi:hypothetical protein
MTILLAKKKYIRTKMSDNVEIYQHLCVLSPELPEKWIEAKDHKNITTYINYNEQPHSVHSDHPALSNGELLPAK